MKTGKFLTAVIASAILAFASFTAYASENAKCAETDCGGTYVNGFCTENSEHYEAAKKVSASHHSELNSTHSGYYAIENAGQLYWFAKNVDDGTIGTVTKWGYGDKYTDVKVNAVLTDDITDNIGVLDKDGMPNTGTFRKYNPIGQSNSYYYFEGVFDGNGKTVSGLYCNGSISSNSDSLIGFIASLGDEGTVKDLTLKDSYFSGYEHIGGFVGYCCGKLENCHSYAAVKGYQKVGGVAGSVYNSYAYAENCSNHGKVFGSNYTGGFTGQTGYYAKIKNCANYGDVTWISGSRGCFGGFIAMVGSNTEITNCFNVGNVTYMAPTYYSNSVGGFAAGVYGTVKNCYTTGKVKTAAITASSGENEVGGFAGYITSDAVSKLSNCYYNKDVITQGEDKVTVGFASGGDGLTESQILGVTADEIKSGKVAYLLNGGQTDIVFKQDLKKQDYPEFSGKQVYYNQTSDKYYNLSYAVLGTNGGNVTVMVEEAGKYVLVFADYEDGVLKTFKTAEVDAKDAGEMSVAIPSGITLGTGDKIMLWTKLADMKPLCEEFTVKA